MNETGKVLVVDDEPHVIRSLTFVLNKEGYATLTATNGEEAVEKIRESRPSIVFLDVMIPKKNGYEVCREIKGDPDLKDTHIIMLTARGQAADRATGLSMGADEFMTKPFSPLEVVERVRELLG